MARKTTARHENVVGVYGSAEEARDAIAQLESAGVPAHHIKLVGSAAKQARRKPKTSRADEQTISHSATAAKQGAIVGGVAGATLGLAIGLIILATTDADYWHPEIWTAVIGLVAGVVAGGIIGYRTSVGTSEAWLLTFKIPPGKVCVAVRPDTNEEEGSATEALRRTGPEKVLAGSGRGGDVEQIC
ncbi:MAG TPA: hypothetical protein VM388_12700 [Acidimicrobiales bacterium]|nr:hypothetical protein [Acidimicrobiales bacterium]